MECKVLKNKIGIITNEYGGNHTGVDLVGNNHTLDYIIAHTSGKIILCQDGMVNAKGSSGTASYGNYVKIEHENGYATLYAHMKKGLSVKLGDYVNAGDILGYMGDSGNAYGGHLHFEVWKDGNRINPTEYLNKALFAINSLVDKTTEELAKEVINGVYGNGEERKNRLGSKYNEVQALVNEILGTKVTYLSHKSYNGVSIVDALNEIGIDSSYNYRSNLARINNITNYNGTAEQNTRMLELLRKGNLIKY